MQSLNRSTASTIALDDGASSIAVLEADEHAVRRAADLITESFAADDVAVSFVDVGGGRWRATVYFREAVEAAALRDLVAAAAGPDAAATLRFEQVAARDWVRDSLAGLKPVSTGRFVVHGAHDRAAVPINKIGIEIEAALAFGTGHHGTTRGCLLALDRICKELGRARRRSLSSPCKGEDRFARSAERGGGPTAGHRRLTPTWLAIARRPPPCRGRTLRPRILDLGTGTGVLAIAAARAFRQRVLATDIDRDAVRIASANAVLNGAGPFITHVKADGVAAPALRERGPYDLVFANILLRPLQRMAAPLMRRIAPGGRLVLSGIMASQANAAIAAYHGLTLERRIEIDGWTTLIFRRGKSRRVRVARRRFAT